MGNMTSRALQMDELEMQRIEARIPELAARAGRAAHERALALRGHVTMVVGAQLVIKSADGQLTPVREIRAPVKGVVGQVLHRRK